MNRRLAPLRVALRIARRDAGRAKARTALVAVMVALPVVAAVAIDVLLRSSMPTDATFARMMLGDLAQARITYQCPGVAVQTPREGAGCSWEGEATGPASVAELETRLVAELPAGAELVRVDRSSVAVRSDGRGEPYVSYGEVALEPAVAGALSLRSGVHPTERGDVLLGSWIAGRLGAGPGDEVVLLDGPEDPVTVTVSGVLTAGARAWDVLALPGTLPSLDDVAAASPETATPEWFVVGDAPVTWDTVLRLNDLGVSVTSRTVLADPPSEAEQPYHEQFADPAPEARTVALVGAVVAAGLLEAVLLIGPAFAVGARRSVRELALLAANGGERRDLRRVVLAGGVVIGGVASAVAAALGVLIGVVVVVWVAPGTFPNLAVPWWEVGGLAVLGTAIAVAASWLPARHASRTDVVAALAGRRAEATPRRAVPITGLVMLGAGTATAVSGALRSQPTWVVVGVMLLLVGMVATSGAIVTGLGRLARWAPLSTRIALRDAARQRSRTAPAVAAVIAAVAGATAGLTYVAASEQHAALAWTPVAALGTVQVSAPLDGADAVDHESRLDRLAAAVEDVAPLASSAPVHMLAPASDPESSYVGVYPEIPPQNQCPLWSSPDPVTPQEQARYRGDPRCSDVGSSSVSRVLWSAGFGAGSTLVDDGTVIALLGLPGAEDAARALADGAALVNDANAVWPDGTAHVTVDRVEMSGSGLPQTTEIVLPAHVVDWSNHLFSVVLPPSAVAALDGVVAEVVGLVGQPTEPFTEAQAAAAAAAVGAVDVRAGFQVEEPYRGQGSLMVLVIVAAAAVVALGATWIAVGLAAAESRADLATLAAVGAAPRTRRRVAGAQAGAVAVTGVVLGVLAGLLLGAVVVLVQRAEYSLAADPLWQVVVPWDVVALVLVGLPLLAVGGSALVTRSRLPMVRRIAA